MESELPIVTRYRELQKIEAETQAAMRSMTLELLEAVCKFKVHDLVLYGKQQGRVTSRAVSQRDFAATYKVQAITKAGKNRKNWLYYGSWIPEAELQKIEALS